MRSEDHHFVRSLRAADFRNRVVSLERVAREGVLDVRLDAHRLSAPDETLKLRIHVVADDDLRHRRYSGRASRHREQTELLPTVVDDAGDVLANDQAVTRVE